MKQKLVPSEWLEQQDRRLDCGPYLSGAMEAYSILSKLPATKTPLKELTRGGIAGIFNGPRFARSYVSDEKYGVPFLDSTDINARRSELCPDAGQEASSGAAGNC